MKKKEHEEINIKNEKELRVYLRTHKFQEPVDEEEMIRLYRKMVRRQKINEFRAAYDCKHCYYFQQKMCKAMDYCFMESESYSKSSRDTESLRCPKDAEGDCPYGNEVGTCFGFCMHDILSEMQERKRRYEKGKEETKDGG